MTGLSRAALLLAAALLAQTPARADDNADQAMAGPQFALVKGVPTLTLDAQARRNAGIVAAPAQTLAAGAGLPAFGQLVSTLSLQTDQAGFDAARDAAAASAVRLRLATAARIRARALYANHATISAAERDAATLAEAEAEAEAAAATAKLTDARAGLTARYGATLAHALQQDTGVVPALLGGAALLARLTVPPDSPPAPPPAFADAHFADGQTARLTYLGRADESDPTFPGAIYYFTLPAQPGLLPGMGVRAHLPAAAAGAKLVPQSAVIWLQGAAYVYLRTAPDQFIRVPITPHPANTDDAYAVTGLPDAMPLVVVGAGMLLSEEFRAVATAGGDQD